MIGKSPVISHLVAMKRWFAFVGIAWLAIFSSSLVAQSQPGSERRFLFIAETSKDMKKMSDAAHQSIIELIQSGMGGVMEDGDTLGIWTFNEEIHTGLLPM